MKLIDRIKKELKYAGRVDMDYCPEVTCKDLAALIEFVEATERWLYSSRHSGPEWDRLLKARAALEKEER